MISIDIEKACVGIAAKYHLPASTLLALIEVETGGDPFERDGRTPRFLFERHKFYSELKARAPEKLQEAIDAGLAIPAWDKANQYRDLGSSSGRMKVLAEARAIHTESANRACSWGLGQIMGFNAEALGYASASSMVSQMSNVRAQIESIVRFLKWKKLDDELERKDYEGLARGYNGAAYKKNSYHTKLEAADKRWEIKLGEVDADEVEVPVPVAPVQNSETSLKEILTKPEVLATGSAVVTGAASSASGSNGSGPMQYAFAALMVIAGLIAAYYIVKRIREG